MGGRGASYVIHADGLGTITINGKTQNVVDGFGHDGLDELARMAGFSQVLVSQEYAARDSKDKHSTAMLGAMMHDVGQLERIFHVLQDSKTKLLIGNPGNDDALASMMRDNSVMTISSLKSSKQIINATRANIRSGKYTPSGSPDKISEAIAHVPIHEYGHAVANAFKKKTGRSLDSAVQFELQRAHGITAAPDVSGYGKIDTPHEWAAEVFAQAFGRRGKRSAVTEALRTVLRRDGGYNV